MVQTEWKMNALMIVVVLPLVASAATLAEFKGEVGEMTGWKCVGSEAGKIVYIPFEGYYESKGGRIESPRFKLDGEVGKNCFYRLAFSARCPVDGYWWVDFFDKDGRPLPDVNSRLYASECWMPYDVMVPAHPDAAFGQIAFVSKKGAQAKDVLFCRATAAETAKWCNDLAVTLPKQNAPKTAGAWTKLPKAREKILSGKSVNIVFLGDSIVNDTWCGNVVALMQDALPNADLRCFISVRGSTGCWYYHEKEHFEEYVAKYKPDLVLIGGISNYLGKEKGQTLAKAEDLMVETVIRCQGVGAEVVVCTPPPSYEFRKDTKCRRFDPRLIEQAEDETYRYLYSEYERRAAARRGVQVWDLTTAPCDTISRSGKPFNWFKRDAAHNDDRGKQLIAQTLADYFRAARRQPIAMDMVHHNPGDTPFESKFLDPDFLSGIGYHAKVVNDFKAPQCACTFEELDASIFPVGSVERKWVDDFAAECEANAKACHEQWLECYYFTDIIVLPRSLIKKYASEICDKHGKVSFGLQKTLELHRMMLREMLRRIPSVDGYVIRTGEMYSHNVPYHGGNTPLDFRNGLDSFVETHAKLINLLREELCVHGGKKVFYRTWDFRRFHKRPDLYLAITEQVQPHNNLYFSIKHTSEDYLRYTTFNPTLGIGRHKQIVEVQCQREYEGKGAYPNYIVKGAVGGFEENAGLPGLKGIAELSKRPHFAGVWTWSRGGGWEGPYLKNELWCEMNAFVMNEWTHHPDAGEEAAFEKFMERKGVAVESRAAFRKLAILSADAVVRGMGNLPPERVKACWTRDHFIGDYKWLKRDYERLVTNGLVKVALANKREAVRIWEEIARLAESIRLADKSDEHYVRTSAQYGLRLYRIYEAGWTVTLLGYQGDKTGVYDKEAIADGIRRYDEAWCDYRRLPDEAPDCATLFDGHFARYHISQDHNSIDPVPGMDAEVDRYRKLIGTK